MLNLIMIGVRTIVFKGFNGTSLILPLVLLLLFMHGQARDFITVAKKIWGGK